MGGVGAMREREKQRKSGWGWDEEQEKGDGNQHEGQEDEEDGAGFKSGEYDGEEKRHNTEKEEFEADDEGYTMDMMLKALNIELDLIGFDKGAQRWVD